MNIYELHSKRFANIEAWVITQGEGLVARVVFETSKSGMTVTCWLHLMGTKMVKATVKGGGYDRHSAAFENAVVKIGKENTIPEFHKPDYDKFVASCKDEGSHWDMRLREQGYCTFQAV